MTPNLEAAILRLSDTLGTEAARLWPEMGGT